ncbi:16S rRNA (guanine(527)-N(7))-methyltransferase RsmG [Actinotalea ferrariae]|uniref:16S rRNA (guanine(527)-N(7))-methyltransferase RsmG n=1 Tax=Actinotalea ferrariae TaxID=1386098 RepID=UPI001C8BD450|nr:16S rRNA (guanine(527)-N(7))-methyltransferase RsmG [Actinotalea ferrariae]MBX9245403.1 16S rRNA (guanine(527)-N(7))-methyltransferase RsmG [Actinotalea ferrariae]
MDPAVLDAALGAGRPAVERFHDMLAEQGITRGLIGPREVPRLWERHLLNSAAVATLLPAAGTLVDVGSGAGLPGVVLAALRPDLHVILLEPMERRVAWLTEVVAELGLTSTEVRRGRAEELHGRLAVEAVTARAVAPMDRLAGWTLPLLRAGGALLAMKGQQADEELAAARDVIDAWGGGDREVLDVTAGGDTTRVVRVVRESLSAPSAARARRPKRR